MKDPLPPMRLTSYGKTFLHPVSIHTASNKRVLVALRAARRRWPDGMIEAKGPVIRYMVANTINPTKGPLCGLLIQSI